MLVKQIQFRGRDDQGNVFCQPIIGRDSEGYLEKNASESWQPSNLHPAVREFVKSGAAKNSDKGVYVLVSALGASEYWGSNVNGDDFPEAALIHSPKDWEKLLVTDVEEARKVGQSWEYGYPTFMGAHPYKHHVNKDPSRAFGRVELAVWNPKMKRVELVVFLDRELCKKFGAEDVLDRIENGEFPDVSMGCKVPYDRCTICGNKSKTRKDYCSHALQEMNRIYPDGRKVAVINDYPKFFDISFVFIGADKSAKMLAKLAHVNNQVCMGDFCAIPRLSTDVGSVFSKAASSNPIQELNEFFSGMQKVANDPIKKKIEVSGVPVWVEWKKGETRQYKDGKGTVKYKRDMEADYGYIPDTLDADGEELDVYVGPDTSSKKAFVVDQLKKDGSFDEHKVMLGFASKEDAKASYVHHMGGTPERFGGMSEIPTSSLKALFGRNGESEKTAEACECGGGCCQDKLAAAFGQKSASHAKLSEITKVVPAGPFSKRDLPKLEKAEGDIPKQTLDEMAKTGMVEALSTAASLGIVLKPQEFQRMLLVKIGEAQMANHLDAEGLVFAHSDRVDSSFAVTPAAVDQGLRDKLAQFMPARSVVSPLLEKRAFIASRSGGSGRPMRPVQGELHEKVAELYNGYRQSLVKRATFIDSSLVSDPHLSRTCGAESLVTAFAGGISKTSQASVLGPESLAYLIGAHYEDREFLVGTLTQSGAHAAA
jgi:inorganic pyrophosphatase